jgi:hypothetical protein
MSGPKPSKRSFKQALQSAASFRPERTLWAWRYFVLLGAGWLSASFVWHLAGSFVAWGVFCALLYGLGIAFPKRFGVWLRSDPDADAAKLTSTNPHAQILAETYRHIGALARARHRLPADVSTNVTHLHAHAKAIADQTTKNPQKFALIMRFFTYYLPSTADLVTDRLKLEGHAGSDRLIEIDSMLARLVGAFAAFESAALAPELDSVDLDVELLGKALSIDLDEMMTR